MLMQEAIHCCCCVLLPYGDYLIYDLDKKSVKSYHLKNRIQNKRLFCICVPLLTCSRNNVTNIFCTKYVAIRFIVRNSYD